MRRKRERMKKIEKGDDRIPYERREREKRRGTKMNKDKGKRRTVRHKAQVRILFSRAGRGRGKMVPPRWVKYSGPVPSKGAGLSPPWTP